MTGVRVRVRVTGVRDMSSGKAALCPRRGRSEGESKGWCLCWGDAWMPGLLGLGSGVRRS